MKKKLPVHNAQKALFFRSNAFKKIKTTRPNNNQQKKRTCWVVDFAVSTDHRIKLKESEKKDKYLDLARELKKKTVDHKSDGITNCNWSSWYSHQRIGTRTRRL